MSRKFCTPSRARRQPLWRPFAAVVFAALSVACGGETPSPALSSHGRIGDSTVSPDMMLQRVAPAPARAAAVGKEMGFAVAGGSVAPPNQPTSGDDATRARSSLALSMVIRSGNASVEVDSLERAIASVQRLTLSFGGYVGNTAILLGRDQVRRASIELRIPRSRYDEAVAGLSPLGRVESVNSSAEDVGEEYVDLSARIANAQRLESRLVLLLANRTGRLADALAVERELARVREEIERHEGRARYLSARVAMSTLTVELHERAPLVAANPGQNVIGDAVKNAWRNFVMLLATGISSLGVVVPVVAVAAVAYKTFKRRRPAKRPASEPTDNV